MSPFLAAVGQELTSELGLWTGGDPAGVKAVDDNDAHIPTSRSWAAVPACQKNAVAPRSGRRAGVLGKLWAVAKRYKTIIDRC